MDEASPYIAAARRMLDNARVGQRDFTDAGSRALPGLYAAITSARSVTFALQNMRGHVDGFDEWYMSHQAQMREDPVCRWAVDTRNRIEKQGNHGGTVIFGDYISVDLAALSAKAPPGTVSTFIGDSLGRNGWLVSLPDGSEETVYFSLPAGAGGTSVALNNAPDGRALDDLLCELLDGLERLITDAENHFGR